MNFEAILLDFDNTIVNTEQINYDLFDETMCKVLDCHLDNEDYENFVGKGWKCIFRYLADKYGEGVDPVKLRTEFISSKYDYFSKHKVEIAKGLDAILELNIPKAIVTGSSMEEVKMFACDIDLSAFDFIITDDLYEKGKPDPTCYNMAMERLSVPSEKVIAVEDSSMGLRAVRNANIIPVFTKEFTESDHSSLADFCVNSLGDILNLSR